MLYLLDANVVITAKDSYYAIDQVPEFWEWLVHQGEQNKLKIPRELFDEVNPGNDKDHPFFAWRKHKTTVEALQLKEQIDPEILQRVIDDGYGKNLTDDQLITIGADPFLVAYSLAQPNRTVVTTEVSRPKAQRQNRKLPDVCDQFAVPRLNTFEMTRALGWKTNWRP
jgi:hypothetical protein